LLEQKATLLKGVMNAAEKHLQTSRARSYFPLFIDGFFRHVSLTYLRRHDPEFLAEQAMEAWKCTQKRSSSRHPFSMTFSPVIHHKGEYYLTFIQNDQAFLYDTVTLFLETHGIQPKLLAHPVWCIARDSEGTLQEIHQQEIPHGQWESLIFIYIKSLPGHLTKERFLKSLQHILTAAHSVVDHYPFIQDKLNNIIKHLSTSSLSSETEAVTHYLRWLMQQNFVFLGYRYFPSKIRSSKEKLGLFCQKSYDQEESLVPTWIRTCPALTPNFLPDPIPLLTYSKTNYRSPVHQPSRINSLEILDQKSNEGLHQFIGLYTYTSFTHSVFSIPIIKEKVQQVFDSFGVLSKGYDGKLLTSILESIPQDELLSANSQEIYEMAKQVFQLKDNGFLSLFLRPHPLGTFINVLIYMPLDRYNEKTKERFAKILEQVLGGKITSNKMLIGNFLFARLIFVVSYETPQKITHDLSLLEQELGQASLSWPDRLAQELDSQFTEEQAQQITITYQEAFGSDYQEKFSINEALFDLPYLEELNPDNPIQIRLYDVDTSQKLKVKIYHYETALALSDMLPILNNLGLQPAAETSFRVYPKDKSDLWIHDFDLKVQPEGNLQKATSLIVEAFYHTWNEENENDELNGLIPLAYLSWRQVMILRAYLSYFKQIKFGYSLAYCMETLLTYPHITAEIINLFKIKFDPSLNLSWKDRQHQRETQEVHIQELLQSVVNLDHDRILQHLLMLVQTTLRTNYFQDNTLKDTIAFKLDSSKIIDLPEPHPWVEVFIHSPRFQAVHLRGSPVSRGGIRWSDRPEDFRTEILGLMKAQTVKNSIIIPLGSKGGFVLKNPTRFLNRQQLQDEVVACYRLMIQNLLSLCDNRVDDRIVPPPQVIRYDNDDTYLVVAADKGTASFSDIANSISKDYHFWLDDAFASGGATGYDHKAIGVTAKGAWESVKRHFREVDQDMQNQDFTVVGVGDMSGDIFGNGMLMSPHIHLVAAFNHQHIFLDPTPDPTTSFQERQRLFQLPYSTWADYQAHLLSKGGGVFERTKKTIPLSPEVRSTFAIADTALPPEKLIQKLLQAPVDLLWFGGIGTFVKASTESHTEVGDAFNDSLRVDAKTLKARIIVEGANLGVTQKARVEYALHGGKINADFIDNSAGVDCSDHEVNIKILFHKLLRERNITQTKRDALLKDMTEEVIQLILKDNYQQTQILSQLEHIGHDHWGRWQSLIYFLENTAKLDRRLECLPNDEEIEQRLLRLQGPTRPELSILISYSKNALYSLLLKNPLVEDSLYEAYLFSYFPKILQKDFAEAIRQHPLRKEIIATTLANTLINRMGPLFIPEQAQAHGIEAPTIVHTFFLVHAWLDLDSLWQAIENLDNQVPIEKQMQAFQAIQNILGDIIIRLVREGMQDELPPKIHELLARAPLWMTDKQRQTYTEVTHIWQGFPTPLLQKLQQLSLVPAILMIHHLTKITQQPLDRVAFLYFQASETFALDHLQNVLSKVKCHTDWQESMLMQLSYEVVNIQTQFILAMVNLPTNEKLESWYETYAPLIPRLQALQPETELAYFSFIIDQLKKPLQGKKSYGIDS